MQPTGGDLVRIALMLEVAELRQQLADAQDLLVETAVDAGQLHSRVRELEAEVAQARAERDAWRVQSEATLRRA